MASRQEHYLKGEPSLILWDGGPSFSLFYDYDEIRDGKISRLTNEQKALWFCRRIDMTFLEPLRRIWMSRPSGAFQELMDTTPHAPRSFSIAIMSVMLNGVEALGSFLKPEMCRPENDRDENERVFRAFVEKYMTDWWDKRPVPGENLDLAQFLWKKFRNGIAHGFCIEKPGSLEFLEHDKFRWTSQVLQVCPIHFFEDLDRGVRSYFEDLRTKHDVLEKFGRRFNVIYPSLRQH